MPSPARVLLAVSLIAAAAFLRSGGEQWSADQPFVRKALEYLATLAQEDGGIHDESVANYVTSAAVMALDASGDPKYRPLLTKAKDFLVGMQSDEGEGYQPSDKYYGGCGYSVDERPDLSNVAFWIEATRTAGLKPEDAAVKKALVFLNRCQNHSETNTSSRPLRRSMWSKKSSFFVTSPRDSTSWTMAPISRQLSDQVSFARAPSARGCCVLLRRALQWSL